MNELLILLHSGYARQRPRGQGS